MDRLSGYGFVFFDFDGLLVNTERLHYLAYRRMCAARGYELPWDFEKYTSLAHLISDGIKNGLALDLPDLIASSPDWSVLYEEKKREYFRILDEGIVEPMPGVAEILELLNRKKIPSCIVTHSFAEQIDRIAATIPLLSSIPYRITREDYTLPKPAPDAYLEAKRRYVGEGVKVIGFEDTLKGWQALSGAGVDGVLISSGLSQGFLARVEENKIPHFSSFTAFLSS